MLSIKDYLQLQYPSDPFHRLSGCQSEWIKAEKSIGFLTSIFFQYLIIEFDT
jgi:hypothetical protein